LFRALRDRTSRPPEQRLWAWRPNESSGLTDMACFKPRWPTVCHAKIVICAAHPNP
jgi:hypothetical protein